MPPLGHEELLALITVMRKMDVAATSCDWQELSRLDDERRGLLQFGVSDDIHTGETADITTTALEETGNAVIAPERAAMIKEIQSLDQQILVSLQEARQKLLDENHELSAQVKAKNMYAQTNSIG